MALYRDVKHKNTLYRSIEICSVYIWPVAAIDSHALVTQFSVEKTKEHPACFVWQANGACWFDCLLSWPSIKGPFLHKLTKANSSSLFSLSSQSLRRLDRLWSPFSVENSLVAWVIYRYLLPFSLLIYSLHNYHPIQVSVSSYQRTSVDSFLMR